MGSRPIDPQEPGEADFQPLHAARNGRTYLTPSLKPCFMSNQHYFPRYTQAENQVTNNVLLLLSRLQIASPKALEEILNRVVGDDFGAIPTIGLALTQQSRGSTSVPDAHLRQEAIDIFVETKINGGFDREQIARHLGTIASKRPQGGENVYLFLLAPELCDLRSLEIESSFVKIIPTTFETLANEAAAFSTMLDFATQEIVDDFHAT